MVTIRVTWTAPADDGGESIDNYKVYRATTQGGSYGLVHTTPNGTIYLWDDTTASEGVDYYYKVTASNVVGESSLSASAGLNYTAYTASIALARREPEIYDSSIALARREPEIHDVTSIIALREIYIHDVSTNIALRKINDFDTTSIVALREPQIFTSTTVIQYILIRDTDVSTAIAFRDTYSHSSDIVLEGGLGTNYSPEIMLKGFDLPTLYTSSTAISLTKSQNADTSTAISLITPNNIDVGTVTKLLDNPETLDTSSVLMSRYRAEYSTDTPISLQDIETVFSVKNTIKDTKSQSATYETMLLGSIPKNYSIDSLIGYDFADGVYSPGTVILVENDIPLDVSIAIRDTLSIPYETSIELVIRNNIAYVVGLALETSFTSDYKLNGIIVLRTPSEYNPSTAIALRGPTTYGAGRLVKQLNVHAATYSALGYIQAAYTADYGARIPLITDITSTYDSKVAISKINTPGYVPGIALRGGIVSSYQNNLLITGGLGEFYGSTMVVKAIDQIKTLNATSMILGTIQNTYDSSSAIALRENHGYGSTSLTQVGIVTSFDTSNVLALREEHTYGSSSAILLGAKSIHNASTSLMAVIATVMFASVALYNIQENTSDYGGSVVLTLYGIHYPVYVPINMRGIVSRDALRVTITRFGTRLTIEKLGTRITRFVRQGSRAIIKKTRKL